MLRAELPVQRNRTRIVSLIFLYPSGSFYRRGLELDPELLHGLIPSVSDGRLLTRLEPLGLPKRHIHASCRAIFLCDDRLYSREGYEKRRQVRGAGHLAALSSGTGGAQDAHLPIFKGYLFNA